MYVLPNFLPDAPDVTVDPSGATLEKTRPYFLFVGRLEHSNGLQDVIPLILNDGTAELWVAGTGSDEPEMRRLVQGRSQVCFLGKQTPPAVARSLSRRSCRDHALQLLRGISEGRAGGFLAKARQSSPAISARIPKSLCKVRAACCSGHRMT